MINLSNPHVNRLRLSGLRPTKQRLAICKVLFDKKETFHFTIDNLKKKIEKTIKGKIAVATIYNTVHAFDGYTDKNISEMAKENPSVRGDYARTQGMKARFGLTKAAPRDFKELINK